MTPAPEEEKAREVAGRLSRKQRSVVLDIAALGNSPLGYSASELGAHAATLNSLRPKGVCMAGNLYGGGMRYRLERFGLLVATHLQKES